MKNLPLRCLVVLTLGLASVVFSGGCQCTPPAKASPAVHAPEGKEGPPVFGNTGPHNNGAN